MHTVERAFKMRCKAFSSFAIPKPYRANKRTLKRIIFATVGTQKNRGRLYPLFLILIYFVSAFFFPNPFSFALFLAAFALASDL